MYDIRFVNMMLNQWCMKLVWKLVFVSYFVEIV